MPIKFKLDLPKAAAFSDLESGQWFHCVFSDNRTSSVCFIRLNKKTSTGCKAVDLETGTVVTFSPTDTVRIVGQASASKSCKLSDLKPGDFYVWASLVDAEMAAGMKPLSDYAASQVRIRTSEQTKVDPENPGFRVLCLATGDLGWDSKKCQVYKVIPETIV